MIKNILFDLDDTILDFHKAEKIALTKTLEHFGVSATSQAVSRYSEINLSQWRLYELKKLTLEQVKVRRYEIFFGELGIVIDAKQATAYYESMLAIGHYFIEGAPQILEQLYGKYNLYIASNGTPHVQHSRIESADIEKYFNGIFISNEIGFSKPSKEFFDYCFSHMENFYCDNTIIVGDSLSSDIKGGKSAGIKTAWFNPKFLINNTEIVPDFEIHTLDEIKTII